MIALNPLSIDIDTAKLLHETRLSMYRGADSH
jgi:hypothetical protein